MKAQGIDPAPLDLLKAHFNPDQPRWPAGSGRDSGEWSGDANIDTAGVKELISYPNMVPKKQLSMPSKTLRVQEQNITRQYKIEIEVGGRKLSVPGYVLPDGTIRIEMAYR